MQPTFSIVVGGVLPFGAVFIELFFILSSIWLHQFYYVFGFLLLVLLILAAVLVLAADSVASRERVPAAEPHAPLNPGPRLVVLRSLRAERGARERASLSRGVVPLR